MAQITSKDISDFFNGTLKLIKEQEVGNELFKRALTKSGEISGCKNLNGFIAENWHELTFNFNARQAHIPFRAKALAPDKYVKNSMDLGIYKNGKGLANARYQLKYGKTAEDTIKYIKKGNYTGQQILVPPEQVEAVQKAFPNRKVTAVAEFDGVGSDPLSKAKAVEMQKHMQDGTFKQYQAANFVKGAAVEMGKAGVIGAAICATTETIALYKSYKNGDISGKDYIKEIGKAAGDGGVTGAATAGLMIPVTAVLAGTGLTSAPITIPVSIILGTAVNKIVAPAFGRGEYKEILGEARYYQDLMKMNDDLVVALRDSAEKFEYFIDEYKSQLETHETLTRINTYLAAEHKNADEEINQKSANIGNTMLGLKELYNKI